MQEFMSDTSHYEFHKRLNEYLISGAKVIMIGTATNQEQVNGPEMVARVKINNYWWAVVEWPKQHYVGNLQ